MVGEAGIEPTTPGLEDAALRFSACYRLLPSSDLLPMKMRAAAAYEPEALTLEYCHFSCRGGTKVGTVGTVNLSRLSRLLYL